jgi:hypothetical protein
MACDVADDILPKHVSPQGFGSTLADNDQD